MTYNIDMNIAEYEYTTSDIEYESDSNDSTEYTERMTKLADEQHAMETARLKAEEIARLKTELNVDRFLTWTRPQSTTVTATTHTPLSFESIIADQQTDDTWQSATKKKLKSQSDKTPKKQELCRSLGSSECKYKVCNYAHSIDELYIKDCKHGRECRSIVYNYTTRVYTNKTNKTNKPSDKYKIRKCSHIHPSETLENLEARLIRKPVTEEEMDLDWIAIQEFDAKHPSGFGKKSFVNPATNNLISCVSVEYLLKKKKENQGSTYAYNKPFVYKPFVYKPPMNRFVYTNKQTVAIDPKAKTEQQIKKNHETVASNLNAIKKNSLLIARFEVRTDNKMCQEKVVELKLQNDALVRDNENLTVYTTKLQALLEKKSAETPKKIPIAQTIRTLEPLTRQVAKIDESKSKASSLVSWRKSYRMAVAPVAIVAPVSTPFADREARHTDKKVEKQTAQSHVAQTTTDDVREAYETVPEHSSTSIKRDLCKSVIGGYKCPVGSDCRFAHSLDDLNITKCTFGTRCYDVVYASDGKVTNANGERTRVCQRLHPNESIQNVRSRLKMYDVPVVKAVKSFKDAEVVKSIKSIAPVVEMVEMVEVFPCAPPPSPMVDFENEEESLSKQPHQQEGGWTTVKQRQRVQHVKPVAKAVARTNIKATTNTNANRNTPSNTKTEMCRLGAKCTRPTCYFAHSAKELNVTDCVFGDRCRLATRSANIGVYHDTSGIKCSRLHPGETKKSLYDRLKL